MAAIVVNLFAADFFLDGENLGRVVARLHGKSTGWEKDYLADIDALVFLRTNFIYFRASEITSTHSGACRRGVVTFRVEKPYEPRIHRYFREARALVHRLCRGDSRGQHAGAYPRRSEREPQGSASANPGGKPPFDSAKAIRIEEARADHNRSLSATK